MAGDASLRAWAIVAGIITLCLAFTSMAVQVRWRLEGMGDQKRVDRDEFPGRAEHPVVSAVVAAGQGH